MLFPSRTPRSADRYLPFKTAALVAGVVLILLSDRLADRTLAWIAMGLLGVAFLLRFLPQRPTGSATEDAENDTD